MQQRGTFFGALALATALSFLAASAPAQTTPVITEIMAINNTSLTDEDGSRPDWIEIYNPSPNPVNLENWSLTDNSGNLTKWRFPATNLQAFSYLIVFASGKNRAVPGAPLHTSFNLDGGGEYLALVDSQTNVVFAFAPRFPAQIADNSFGPGMLATPMVPLVPVGASARYQVPAADGGSTWKDLQFDDTAWAVGPTALGYDASTNYTSDIATDLTGPMRNNNATVYARIPFATADPSAFQDLKLRMRYDDGFIAYLNGVEVARANAPVNAAWNAAALALHGSESGAGGQAAANFDGSNSPYTTTLTASSGYTTSPATVQAAGAGTSGQFLRLVSEGTAYICNSVAFDRAVAGVFPMITTDFDFRITDVDNNPADGFAFLLIPTSGYGASGAGAVRSYLGIEEPNIAGVFAVGFDMYPHATANDVSLHWNGAEAQNVTIPLGTLNLVNGTFHRCSVKLEFAPDGSGAHVTVTITPNINGTPGTPIIPFDRFFISGLAPFESRVEFAARTGGAHMAVDLDNINAQFFHKTGAVPAEDFDISRFLGLLQAGTNVLAIQGLNVTTNSADFLLEPQLLGRSLTVQRDQWVFFSPPTPAAFNASGAAEIAPNATYSIPGGLHTSNLTLSLSSPLPGAVIYYTTNGAPVTEASRVYSNAIPIAGSLIVSTRVYAPGYLPSPQISQHYTLLDAGAAAFSSSLPIVIVDTLGQTLNRDMEPRPTGIFTVIDTSPTTGRAAMTKLPDYQGRAGMEGRGQSSWDSFPKKGINVETRGENDLDKKVSFLDFPPGSDFALINLYTDKTFLNDFLGYELYEAMGHYAVRRRFVEVFYNGQMFGQGTADTSPKVGLNDRVGIYLLVEKIRVDAERVNISKPQSGAPDDPITGGYVWKKDKDSPNDVNFTTSSGQFMKYHDPRGDQLTTVQRTWLLNYLNQFESVFYSSNWRDPISGYSQYVDVDNWVDQHWIVEFTKQIDGYRLSNYMQKDRNGKIKMSPIWDWNLSFGNANYLEGGRTNGWYWPLINSTEHIWLRQLVGTPGDPDFKQKIIDRWPALSQGNGPFNLTNLLARIKELSTALAEPAAYDFQRWPRLGTYIWPNPNGAAGGWHVDYQTPGTYAGIILQMTNWVTGRHRWIDGQILKPPTFSRHSGPAAVPLTMTVPTGTIYYTLNGADPRISGGAASPAAQVYSGDIVPPPNAKIVARAFSNGQWSPPVTASFGEAAPALIVSELMYHPAAGPGYDKDEFEFIELMNASSNVIDLGGVRFMEGVNFTFPLGALQPAGAATTNNFDASGTPFTASKLGTDPAASVTTGGPAGSFIRLLNLNSGTNRNRIAFDQTATGPYDQFTAEFDFRAENLTPPQTVGTPTAMDFDAAGSAYTLRSFDTLNPDSPVIMPAEAGSAGSYLRLTKAVNDENGGVYFDATADRAYNVVIINFDFRCNGAADGFGAAFLNTATHGLSGVGPSFTEEANVAGSIGAGFDIYLNTQSATEPNANHVSLHANGAQVTSPANGTASPTLSLTANKFHRVQMTIQFTGSQALVTLKISPDVNGTGGAAETLFNNFVINGITPYRGRMAFCARTGGANASQDIDNVNVQYLDSLPATAGGLSFVLLPTATFGVSGAGSTLAHYTDTPSAAGLFALNFDLHSSSAINDANVHWNGSQVGNITIPSGTLNLDNGVFHHARLDVTRAGDGSRASLTITPDIFGTPGAPMQVYSNLQVTGFFPGNARIELAARSGGQNLSLDVDNLAVQYATNSPVVLPPGERLLLVRNLEAFVSRYGSNLPIAGVYSGQLDNGGERLLIAGRYGQPLLDFSYQDGWLPLSDGYGFSMVAVLPASQSQWNDASAWRLSGAANGSPGAVDVPAVITPVIINEVLTRPVLPLVDAVELHNPGTNAADISNWYLSDDFQQPYKYQFPAGTVIQPSAFLVVTENQFNQPWDPARFALQGEGEEIYLFSANASGQLSGYYQGFDFGAAEDNVSFGRHLISTGNDHFVAQTAMTLGTNNASPLVGPVVISEVMYHPPDYAGGVDNKPMEFIELRNITDQPVWLFDPMYPAHTWRLRDAVDFTFPTGVIIPPQGYILVVSFDPVADTAYSAEFRNQYGVPTAKIMYGPYRGKLDNSGESVELVRPGRPDATTGRPDEILADKVRYADNPPWSQAADGSGYSLHRLDVLAYGNDPANWTAGLPTAARGFTPGTPPTITLDPVSQIVLTFDSVTLSAAATGDGPLSYQWRFNGNLLAGATNPVLTLSSVQPDQAGDYHAVVMAPGGAAETARATLTVYEAARFTVQPKSSVVIVGNGTNFTAQATGNGPVTYQWRFNDAPVPDATNATLTLTNLQIENSGFFTVVATDGVGSLASQPAYLAVGTALTVTKQPTGQVVAVGQTLTVTAGISGSDPKAYKWNRVTSDITAFGETGETLVIPNIQLSDAGVMRLAATNVVRTTALYSSPATIVVVQPPVDRTAHVGGSVSLSVVANPVSNARFQWQFQGTNLAGKTTATLALSNVQLDQAGTYTCVVTNGSYTAAWGAYSCQLTVVDQPQAPVITSQPVGVLTNLGANVSFQVAASGTELLTYQWWHNQTNLLAGATNNLLAYTNIAAARLGAYQVVVSNSAGVVTSEVANLEAPLPPAITAAPVGTQVLAGVTVDFSVQATGTPPLAYQWWRMGAGALMDATNASLTVQASPSTVGDYWVVVRNPYGEAASAAANLNVLTPPRLLVQPQALNLTAGATARFFVVSDGDAPLNYQWYRDTGLLLPGANSSALVISNAQSINAGAYYVAVVNAAGAATSAVVNLTIGSTVVDSDNDGLPDDWEQQNGLVVGIDDANLDADGDGLSNREEYIAGTHPGQAESVLRLQAPPVVGGGLTLRFEAVANRPYLIEYRDTLGPTNWLTLENVPAAATNRWIELPQTTGDNGQRYYRLGTPGPQ